MEKIKMTAETRKKGKKGTKRRRRKDDDIDTLIMTENIKVEEKVAGECV
jgi:hypothetical protein